VEKATRAFFMERMEKMKPEWKDLRRKPSVEDLRKRLNRLNKIHQEHESLMRTMLELTHEKVENTLYGKDHLEEKDLESSLVFVERQREALASQYRLELKRLYRFLETVREPEVKLILTLRYAHFLSFEEIAEVIGMGVEKVENLHEAFILER
jgi:DNA-directed RNA polymerase specialized sigma subunit